MTAEAITGGIGAGKTTVRIKRINDDISAGRPVTCFRASIDTRVLNDGDQEERDYSRLKCSVKSRTVGHAREVDGYIQRELAEDKRKGVIRKRTYSLADAHFLSGEEEEYQRPKDLNNVRDFLELAEKYSKHPDVRLIFDLLVSDFAGRPFEVGGSGRTAGDMAAYGSVDFRMGKCKYFYKDEYDLWVACDNPAFFNLRLLNGFPAPIDTPLISSGSERGKPSEYRGQEVVETYPGCGCHLHHIVPKGPEEWPELMKKLVFPQPKIEIVDDELKVTEIKLPNDWEGKLEAMIKYKEPVAA